MMASNLIPDMERSMANLGDIDDCDFLMASEDESSSYLIDTNGWDRDADEIIQGPSIIDSYSEVNDSQVSNIQSLKSGTEIAIQRGSAEFDESDDGAAFIGPKDGAEVEKSGDEAEIEGLSSLDLLELQDYFRKNPFLTLDGELRGINNWMNEEKDDEQGLNGKVYFDEPRAQINNWMNEEEGDEHCLNKVYPDDHGNVKKGLQNKIMMKLADDTNRTGANFMYDMRSTLRSEMTPEERQRLELRKERNRQSARKSREKKASTQNNLEKEKEYLTKTQIELDKRNQVLRTMEQILKEFFSCHGHECKMVANVKSSWKSVEGQCYQSAVTAGRSTSAQESVTRQNMDSGTSFISSPQQTMGYQLKDRSQEDGFGKDELLISGTPYKDWHIVNIKEALLHDRPVPPLPFSGAKLNESIQCMNRDLKENLSSGQANAANFLKPPVTLAGSFRESTVSRPAPLQTEDSPWHIPDEIGDEYGSLVDSFRDKAVGEPPEKKLCQKKKGM